MANLAQSGVTVNNAWTEGNTNGRRRICKDVTLVLNAMGTATNQVPASVLGFRAIEESTMAVKSDNAKIYPTCPSADGTLVLFMNPDQAVDANRANPADITATVRLTVKGYD